MITFSSNHFYKKAIMGNSAIGANPNNFGFNTVGNTQIGRANARHEAALQKIAESFNIPKANIEHCVNNLRSANRPPDHNAIVIASTELVNVLAGEPNANEKQHVHSSAPASNHAHHGPHFACRNHGHVNTDGNHARHRNSAHSNNHHAHTAPHTPSAQKTTAADDAVKLDELRTELRNLDLPPEQVESIVAQLQTKLEQDRATTVDTTDTVAISATNSSFVAMNATSQIGATWDTGQANTVSAEAQPKSALVNIVKASSITPSDAYRPGSPGDPSQWYSEIDPRLDADIKNVEASDPVFGKKLRTEAQQPFANWLTQGISGEAVLGYQNRAEAAGKVPVYAIYARNQLDQDGGQKGYSSGGGSASSDAYMSQVSQWADAIGPDGKAVIVVEPDAFMQSQRNSPEEGQRIRDQLTAVGAMFKAKCPNATLMLSVGAGEYAGAGQIAQLAAPILKNGGYDGITVGEAGNTPNIGHNWGLPIVNELAKLGVPNMIVGEDGSRNGVDAGPGWADNSNQAAGLKAGRTDDSSLYIMRIKKSEQSDGRTMAAGAYDWEAFKSLVANADKAQVPGT